MIRGRSRIAENTVALTVAGLAQMAFTLVQLGVLSRHLGSGPFGVFVALKGFALLLSTVMLAGFPQALLRFLPSFQSRGRRRGAVGWFVLFSALATALGALLYLSAWRWIGWMPGGVREAAGTATARWLVLAATALALKQLLFGGLSGLREMRVQMVFELCYQVLLTAFMLAWRLRLDVGALLAAIFVLNAAVWLAGVPVYVALVRRTFLREPPPPQTDIVTPAPVAYWGSAAILSVSALAFTDVDRFIMAALVPVSAIPVFHIASRINQLIKRFLGFPIVAMQPEVTRIYEEGRWNDLGARIALFTRVSVVAALACAALAAAVGREMIVLISGAGYAGAYRLLLLLLPTVPAAAFTAPLTASMRALHFMWWAVMCDLSWMIVYVAGMFMLVPVVGLAGVALAQLAAYAVYAAIAVAFARRRFPRGAAGGRGIFGISVLAAVFAAAGGLACAAWGLPAAAACAALAPLLLRLALRRLAVFDRDEAAAIAALVPAGPARSAVTWVLALEE